jgi:hypothetical protein
MYDKYSCHSQSVLLEYIYSIFFIYMHTYARILWKIKRKKCMTCNE